MQCIAFDLEKAHRDEIRCYELHMRQMTGTKDSPIGDDNYLWLKCRAEMHLQQQKA